MADLSEQSRGQVILVAAFALGVMFIALAVVVNTAIFTENLAARGEGTSDDDALQYRHEVEGSIGTVLEYVNRKHSGSSAPVGDARANISEVSLQGGQQKARLGRVVTVDTVDDPWVNGSRFENATGRFVNRTGNSTWTVVEGASRTRALVVTVSGVASLSGNRSGAFTLSNRNQSTGATWNMSVWRSASDTVSVSVNTTDGDMATCSRSVQGSFEIDVTGGTVNGSPCHALTIADDNGMWFPSNQSSEYDIEFSNGDQIKGGYSGVVTGAQPEQTANPTGAVYSVTVQYVYRTPSLSYETEIRVAPGEPDRD